ncbi:MAG: DUF2851 family protein [Bacteroidales bacterium]|nr:DUF2851 family protein [Bacteroidales bacterium]
MEKVYQYLWKYRMLGETDFTLVDGRSVEIIDPGQHNSDSGPDFFNGKIRIDGKVWAGNIEIHVRASDWYRHGHQNDEAYSSVILHVVASDDARIGRSDGSEVPQLVISLPDGFMTLYESLSSPGADIRCRNYIQYLPSLIISDWLESLGMMRLEAKAARITDVLDSTGGDWEQACFVILARTLGFGLNNDPFEMLARSIPLKLLHRHSDSLFQIEAILFGQAGLLDSSAHIFDEYYQGLCHEYVFLARKYGLRPLRLNWKFARTRPHNLPHRRIAMLARSCLGGFSLFRRILESPPYEDELLTLFDWRIEGYWHDHFSFDVPATFAPCTLSRASREIILINLVAPLIYAYALRWGDYDTEEKAKALLNELRPEQNAIIRTWKALGLHADCAMRSQALLHLKKEYCDAHKCLYCRFGHRFVQGAVIDAF